MTNTLQARINQHQFLINLRTKLLALHKLLLNAESIRYEQMHGKVSKGELLQLAINHKQFDWLHQLSELIVQIDELLRADEPVTSETIAAFLSEIQVLLIPDELGDDFAAKYDAAFQSDPDVVLAHVEVTTLLASVD